MGRLRIGLPAAVAALALAACGSGEGDALPTADEASPWEEIAATMPDRAEPESANPCGRGDRECIDAVAAEMDRRFRILLGACDHNSAFALMYLRVTEGVAETGADDFEDPRFLNHLDAIFADLYFNAYDAWARGRDGDIPEAWLIAFESAADREVSVLGDMLLGMNAHISRDLPFALVRTGLETPGGAGAKPDFDRVNELLGQVQAPMIAEQSRRFDPGLASSSLPALDVGGGSVGELMARWRTEAFENAERLIGARGAEAGRIAAEIEEAASGRAEVIRALTSDLVLGPATAERDEYCAERNRS